jgi:hypothetical protein
MTTKQYKQYTEVSYSGRKLLEQHNLNENGLWKIYGEDPNCDLGGAHHEPELGLVEGCLKDVIEYAVELPRFWQWGSGGRIVKVDVVRKINAESNAKRARLMAEAEDLELRLKKIQEELKEI